MYKDKLHLWIGENLFFWIFLLLALYFKYKKHEDTEMPRRVSETATRTKKSLKF